MTVTERITALRKQMKEKGIDAYLVPTDDFHGSEYVGDYFKCRKYITGFTGSAGTAVIMQDMAGLWTDGRYFIQAAQQLEGTPVTLFKMGEPDVPTIHKFLEENLKEGMCLGFDGRTVSAEEAETLEKILQKKQVHFSVNEDLIGNIWNDRPALSCEPVMELSEKWAGRSRADKIREIRSKLKEKGADLFILTSLDDIAWLLNIRGNDIHCCPVVLSYLVLDDSELRLFVNEKAFSDSVKEALSKDGIAIYPYDDIYTYVQTIPEEKKVFLSRSNVNSRLVSSIPKTVTILDGENLTLLPKAIKNETEVRNEKTAHIKDGVAMVKFIHWLKKNVGMKDGCVKKGTRIHMMATGFTTEVVEVGYFGAGQFIPCDELTAGMVGYITASIKNVRDTRVGDTVTDADNPCAEALPGYKKVNPMVYCGLYPADGAKYGDLRDALEKLQLNDASLYYEPETSVALGFGFRCGFLGLLHLEIIQERLEREYNLDLVTTAPSVIYKVYKTNGEIIELTNPTNLPDPSEIEYMEEPMVKAEIMVTTEFIGAIMDLCQERRGQYEGMEYMEETRALLKYRLPLNEIIYDFFDALKSRSRGYASLDYELDGYERSELVKLDILVNKEEVDALSFIVHADTAYERGRKMCEKLKDEIPRQLFEIPIQAAIGSKVIARETVRAMRKDVLAKCYGGDISRKKKLLEKQKEGKKRMRQVGNVEIPQKAFMSVLKLDDK